MIALEGISKVFGGRVVLRDCHWRIGRGERIGLVGPNGAGKTTLCRIMAGAESPDEGAVHLDRGTTVGYLAQEVDVTATHSVLTEALSGFSEVWELERELEAVAAEMAERRDASALVERYGNLQHRFEALGGYRLEAQATVVLGGLGFAPDALHRSLAEFSGGWRMRAVLARLLLLRPDLLLLDEPTNHLDLESLGWLEGFLGAYDGTVVIVSHDRYFLNRMVTAIADLDRGAITVYRGDYDAYVLERQARRALREAQARNQAKRVAEIERFIARFRYKATKARQVQSRIKMLERLERIEVDGSDRQIRFHFPQPPRAGRVVVRLEAVHKAYGPTVVYRGVDFAVERGERVALIGVNGAGKSTLLKMLAGVLPFERGERALGAHVDVHYYAQHQLDALDPGLTVLEEMTAAAPALGMTRLRTVLGAFLFGGDDVDKRVAVLSGGEKARMALARMLLRPAALLCLDEPTNHLDLASKEVLEQALSAFEGSIVFISHDRYFINRMATRVVEVAAGALTSFLGNYDDYQAARVRGASAPAGPDRLTSPRGVEPAAPVSKLTGPRRAEEGRRRRSTGRGQSTGHEMRALRERLSAVETRIAELEARLGEMSERLAEPGLYREADVAREVTRSRREMEEQVAWLLKEWEEVSEQIAAVDRET